MTQPIGPGDVVVCVDAGGLTKMKPLSLGARYVVREVVAGTLLIDLDTGEPANGCAVALEGIYNPDPRWAGAFEMYYEGNRFRPLRDDDAEIFREMVRDARQPETVT